MFIGEWDLDCNLESPHTVGLKLRASGLALREVPHTVGLMLRELSSESEPGDVKPAVASNIAPCQRYASSVRPWDTCLAMRASRGGGSLNRKVSRLRFDARLLPAGKRNPSSNT